MASKPEAVTQAEQPLDGAKPTNGRKKKPGGVSAEELLRMERRQNEQAAAREFGEFLQDLCERRKVEIRIIENRIVGSSQSQVQIKFESKPMQV